MDPPDMSSAPANGKHRVLNADIHERTMALENQVGHLGEKVGEISRNQERMSLDTRASFDQLQHQQRRSQEELQKMLRDSQDSLNSAITSRDQQQGNNKKFSIQIVVMGVGACMAFVIFAIGGLIAWGNMTVKSYVDSMGVPMRADMNRLETTVARNSADIAKETGDTNTLRIQATTSEVDRKDMRADLNRITEGLTAEVAARRAGFSALQQQLTEAERQHTMQDISRNLMLEYVHSLLGMLFEKMGLPKPAPPAYFPKIGREINTPIPNE